MHADARARAPDTVSIVSDKWTFHLWILVENIYKIAWMYKCVAVISLFLHLMLKCVSVDAYSEKTKNGGVKRELQTQQRKGD